MTPKPIVRAIFFRDLRNWFTNPTGSVFITLFVFLCAFVQFIPARFFQENSAGLAPLAEWFRYLLIFFVPAVTMVVWAGERGHGTDEILLTLPATDGQIVLGKYLAAAGTYTLALLFSLLVPIWVQFLGDPDWGLVMGNYLSFWLLGLFLIGAGMVGSQLTDNLTVAFILGALFCAIVVFSEDVLGLLFPALWRDLFGYGPVELFAEMGRGVITFEAIAFFVGGTAAFLYLNYLLLSRRRWRGARGPLHLTVRLVSLVVAVLALTVLLGRWGPRLDVTAEGLHSLSKETRTILDDLDAERPVTVRAWVSPEVPREYVATRRALLDLLREYDSRGGEALRVEIVETERYSEDGARRRDELRHPASHRLRGGGHAPARVRPLPGRRGHARRGGVGDPLPRQGPLGGVRAHALDPRRGGRRSVRRSACSTRTRRCSAASTSRASGRIPAGRSSASSSSSTRWSGSTRRWTTRTSTCCSCRW
jgi:ABC-2 type transport system permease protein